jgi:hypothetical protein
VLPRSQQGRFETDSALLTHLNQYDPVFRGAVTACRNERLVRSDSADAQTFEYTADCSARRPPEQVDDCHYVVKGAGIVTRFWAWVRDWHLHVECVA